MVAQAPRGGSSASSTVRLLLATLLLGCAVLAASAPDAEDSVAHAGGGKRNHLLKHGALVRLRLVGAVKCRQQRGYLAAQTCKSRSNHVRLSPHPNRLSAWRIRHVRLPGRHGKATALTLTSPARQDHCPARLGAWSDKHKCSATPALTNSRGMWVAEPVGRGRWRLCLPTHKCGKRCLGMPKSNCGRLALYDPRDGSKHTTWEMSPAGRHGRRPHPRPHRPPHHPPKSGGPKNGCGAVSYGCLADSDCCRTLGLACTATFAGGPKKCAALPSPPRRITPTLQAGDTPSFRVVLGGDLSGLAGVEGAWINRFEVTARSDGVESIVATSDEDATVLEMPEPADGQFCGRKWLFTVRVLSSTGLWSKPSKPVALDTPTCVEGPCIPLATRCGGAGASSCCSGLTCLPLDAAAGRAPVCVGPPSRPRIANVWSFVNEANPDKLEGITVQVALSTNGGAPNTSVQWYEVTAATHGVEPIVRSQSLELGANSIDIFEPNPRAPVLCGRSWFFAVRSQAKTGLWSDSFIYKLKPFEAPPCPSADEEGACAENGEQESDPSRCCSGFVDGGVCADQLSPPCSQNGEAATSKAQCCSGFIRAGICREVPEDGNCKPACTQGKACFSRQCVTKAPFSARLVWKAANADLSLAVMGPDGCVTAQGFQASCPESSATLEHSCNATSCPVLPQQEYVFAAKPSDGDWTIAVLGPAGTPYELFLSFNEIEEYISQGVGASPCPLGTAFEGGSCTAVPVFAAGGA